MTSAPPTGYPVFNTPPALARAVRRTGWDACSTASNHTLDRGVAGVASTLRALNRYGIAHAGSATSARGARRITMLQARGVKVAFLAYTTILNGAPPANPWTIDLATPRRIIRDAARARRHGARAVIVNLHWGTEYQPAPDAAQHRLVRRLKRAKAITAIVGQHVHVVQPIRRPGGRWVVFGEGNLLSNQTAACCAPGSQDGILALLHLRVPTTGPARVAKVRYVPTYVRHPDYTVLPVRQALRRGERPQAELRASLRRTVSVVGRRPGLRPAR
jgi:poly-gamma-glutamate synthesis protein (capsule biosynthesis protein)